MAYFIIDVLVALAIGGITLAIMAAIANSTQNKKGKMGINVKGLMGEQKCPKCGKKLPIIRTPKNLSEIL